MGTRDGMSSTASFPSWAQCEAPPGRQVNWHGCHKSGVNLERADLRGAILSGSNLSAARLDGARLIGAYMGQALLDETSFVDANLRGAYLVAAQAQGARFDSELCQ